MRERISRYRQGYLKIEARGFHTERFINLAARNSIEMWQLRRMGTVAVFYIHLRDFPGLCRFAKKASIHIRILERQGCPFIFNQYKRRYVFLGGFALFALVICLMSSLIWYIEIEGNSRVSDYTLLSALKEAGLREGTLSLTLDTKAIEEELKREIGELNWVSIRIEGTRATVQVAEKLSPTTRVENTSPCDIIADKEAYITDIVASSGRPMVKAGDVVAPGDVLISGDITYTQDGTEVVYNRVASSGHIQGLVKRTITITTPYTHKLKRYTAQKKDFYTLKIFNRDFNTNFIKSDVSFEKYDIIREILQPELGDRFVLPLILEKLTYREYVEETIKISPKEAEALSLTELNRRLVRDYPVNSDIINREIAFTAGDGCVILTATVTSREDIGKISEIVPMETKITQGGNSINGTTENTNSE